MHKKDLKEGMCILGIVLTLLIGWFIVLFLIGSYGANLSCNTYSKYTGLETHFSYIGGCFVSTKDGVKHIKELKY